jgi:hypothetical protein
MHGVGRKPDKTVGVTVTLDVKPLLLQRRLNWRRAGSLSELPCAAAARKRGVEGLHGEFEPPCCWFGGSAGFDLPRRGEAVGVGRGRIVPLEDLPRFLTRPEEPELPHHVLYILHGITRRHPVRHCGLLFSDNRVLLHCRVCLAQIRAGESTTPQAFWRPCPAEDRSLASSLVRSMWRTPCRSQKAGPFSCMASPPNSRRG